MVGKQMMTAEEILNNFVHFRVVEANDKIIYAVEREDALEAMQAYAKQQQEIAVEKALDVASEKANIKLLIGDCRPECEVSSELMARVDKKSILSLKPEILKELEK